METSLPEHLKRKFSMDMHLCGSLALPKSTAKFHQSCCLVNTYFPDNNLRITSNPFFYLYFATMILTYFYIIYINPKV